ncbi:hypothetical protein EON64_18190, partial [archaeon]
MQRGVVCVWSADNRGMLAPMRQYKRKGEITQLVFCVLSSKLDLGNKAAASISSANNNSSNSNNSSEGGVKISQFTPSFFFSTDRGTLCYADDMGHCTDIHSLSSSIDILLFYPASSYLLLITRSLLLITYHISGEGKISKVHSVKLSVQNPEVATIGLTQVFWCCPGVFCMATEEKMLRLYDAVLNEGYNLSLSAALGSALDRSDRVVAAAFDSNSRSLAVGTQVGWVVSDERIRWKDWLKQQGL